MSFNMGDRVSIKGYAIPMTVETVFGDDVTVLEYDPKRNVLRRQTYKAAALQLAPKRRAISVSF